MRSNNNYGSRAARARGFTGLWTVLVMGLVAIMAQAAEAHRAYVANSDTKDFSVADRDTNKVVGKPIPVWRSPRGVAITPDEKHVYVTNVGDNTVSVIDTEKSMMVDKVGLSPNGVAVKPGGKKAQCPRIIRARWACCSPNGPCVRLCREFRRQQRFGDRREVS
jgi:YVTN family beta-propeller protein